MAKCQSKSLYDQFFKSSCRYFDMRVRFTDTGDLTFAHGIFEFEGSVNETLESLNKWAKQTGEKVYCRVLLESNSKMKDQKEQNEHFAYFCEYIEEEYQYITFIGGRRKYDWLEIWPFKTDELQLDDKYSSTTSLFNIKWLAKVDDLWPWLYAKLNNNKNLEKGTNKPVLLIDFV